MKSSFERDKFKRIFILIAGIFLAISFVLLWTLSFGASMTTKLFLVLVGIVEVVMVAGIYLLSAWYVDMSYKTVEDANDLMKEIIEKGSDGSDPFEEGTIGFEKLKKYKGEDLKEGTIGIFYDNFEKLINMFREGKRKEKDEKEYLRDVMSDISHQLKTPLASMEVFIDLLLNNKVESKEEQKKVLEEAGNQVSRMEWMVLAMLKLARIEAGAVSFDIKEADLNMILEEVRSGTHYLTDSRGQKLIINCPENIKIKADLDWMVEAVINIVKNASDYTEPTRTEETNPDQPITNQNTDIEIEVEQNSVFTRIYIRDHGIGMSEETMTHIFERFYRASNEVNPNSVGIGLSLSKSIIEGMGGKISVDSKLGEGSCFVITF